MYSFAQSKDIIIVLTFVSFTPAYAYLFGFRGEMSIAGPGAGMSIGNMSTHISIRPFETHSEKQFNSNINLFNYLPDKTWILPTCSMPGLSGFSRGLVSTCSGTSLQPTLGISSQWFSTVSAKCSSVCFFRPEISTGGDKYGKGGQNTQNAWIRTN